MSNRRIQVSALVTGALTVAALALLSLLSGGSNDATAGAGHSHSEAAAPAEISDGDALFGMIMSEAEILSHKLKMGTGAAECVKPCVESRDLEDITRSLVRRCVKIEPALFKEWKGYNSDQHGKLVAGFDAACETLKGAEATVDGRESAAAAALDQLSAGGVK